LRVDQRLEDQAEALCFPRVETRTRLVQQQDTWVRAQRASELDQSAMTSWKLTCNSTGKGPEVK
jgi:hypothetical protein